jgi:hypothetical protein
MESIKAQLWLTYEVFAAAKIMIRAAFETVPGRLQFATSYSLGNVRNVWKVCANIL